MEETWTLEPWGDQGGCRMGGCGLLVVCLRLGVAGFSSLLPLALPLPACSLSPKAELLHTHCSESVTQGLRGERDNLPDSVHTTQRWGRGG